MTRVDAGAPGFTYIPPPPPPPPYKPPPDFRHAMVTATHATTAYMNGHGDATTVNNDWASVQTIITNQYRIALTDPGQLIPGRPKLTSKQAIALLDKYYGSYFQGHRQTGIYDEVVAGSKSEAEGESGPMRTAQINLYNAEHETGSPLKQTQDIATAYIDIELADLFPEVTNGVYTAAQIKQAVGALDPAISSSYRPFFDVVGTYMESGKSQALTDILTALQSGPELTPAEIADIGKGVYTAGQIKTVAGALDPLIPKAGRSSFDLVANILATGVANGRTLSSVLSGIQAITKQGLTVTAGMTVGGFTLTPAEAQLANIDPVSLAFLKAAGVTVTTLSPLMKQLAQENPALFDLLEINGVNISVGTASANPPIDPATGKPYPVISLNNKGSVLVITINGKPLTQAQLASLPIASITHLAGTNQTGAGVTSPASDLAGLYLGGEATSKGSGIVDVAALLLGSKSLLPVNGTMLSHPGTSLSNPNTAMLVGLDSLMAYADTARTQYDDTELPALLAGLPSPTSAAATAAFASTINPFIQTQFNGYFDPTAQTAFGNTVAPSVTGYLTTWFGAQVQGLGGRYDQSQNPALIAAAGNIGKLLSGASPQVANIVVNLMLGQFGKWQLTDNDPRFLALFDDLSQGAQIADGPQKPGAAGPVAQKVAAWIKSQSAALLGGIQAVSTVQQDAQYYGYTDLPNALLAAYPGTTEVNQGIVSGENAYTATLSNELGQADYTAFEANKTSALNAFYAQFAHAPGVGVTISASDTAALRTAIINAYGFTKSDLAPVMVKESNGKTVTVNSTDTKIVNMDVSWIASQSGPGAMVTVLPFLFASATAGIENGVFFDITNTQLYTDPPPKPQTTGGRFATGYYPPPQYQPNVLIDGTAAIYALQADSNAWQNPGSVDVKWLYSGYRDFQLSNDMYQGGTIYTLPTIRNGNQVVANPLGIGPDGAASSATDFHKQFDEVAGDVAGGAMIVGGVMLLPLTDGGSTVLEAIGLSLVGGSTAYGIYQGVSQYADLTSHGEHFGWSNPNARWAIVGDVTLAVNVATMGLGVVEGAFARSAADVGTSADAATAGAATTDAAVAPAADPTLTGDVTPAGDPAAAPGGDPVPAGAPALNGVPRTLRWTRQGLESIGYGLGAAQTGYQAYSLDANWDNMSWSQRISGVANLLEGALPFFMEPINGAIIDLLGPSDPLNPNARAWSRKPVYIIHREADGSLSYYLSGKNGEEIAVDPNSLSTGRGPSKVRIVETATVDGQTVDVAAHYLTRNTDGTYNRGTLLAVDGTLTNIGPRLTSRTGRDSPFDGLVPAPDTAALDAQILPDQPPVPARRAIAFWGAHPDDETNTTAAIYKAIQLGYDVDLVYFTKAQGGTLYALDPVRRIPGPLVDAAGNEIRDANAAVTRGEEPRIYTQTLGGGSNVRVIYLDNPDYNPFDRPADRSVHYTQVANWNVPETEAYLVGMLERGGYEAVFTMTGDPAVHPAHQAASEITQAALRTFEAGGGTAPHLLMAREVGWYTEADLQQLPAEGLYHRIDFDDDQLAAKTAAAEAGYVSQPPGHHNFWPYMRPFEILTSTSTDAISWLRDFMATQPAGQTVAGDVPEPEIVEISDYASPKGAAVEEGALEPVHVKPPGAPSGTELDVLTSLSDPARQMAFPATADDEARINYLLNAPAKYVKPPEALSIRERLGLILSSAGGFWTGYKRNAVIFLSSSRTPLEALGPQSSGLSLDSTDTLVWASQAGARSGAARQIHTSSEGALHYVYRVTAPPDVLINAIENGQFGPELIEGALVIVNDKALPSYNSYLNPDAQYAPPSGEPYSAPRAVGMSGRNVLVGVAKGAGTLATAGAGAFVSVRWGLAGGHLLRAAADLSNIGLSMFGLRAFVNGVTRMLQVRLGNRIEQLNKASKTLTGNQTILDARSSDGSSPAVVGSWTTDVAIATENVGKAVDVVQRETSGWQGTLRGIPQQDQAHYQLMALIQRQNPADFAISGGRAFDQLKGAPGQVLAPESAVGRLWNVIRIASHGFNDANGPLHMATTVWTGIANIASSVATANFIPVHWFNNSSTLFRRFLSLGSSAQTADGDHVVQDYSVQPAGATLRGVYRANNDRPLARWIIGLGDPDGVLHAGKLGDGTPMRKPSFVGRLQWAVFAGTTLGSVPFTIADGVTLVANVAIGNWPGAVVSAGKVIADVIWARGAQQAGVDAARDIRGMGPNVRKSSWLTWLNQADVVAEEYNSDITQQNVSNPRLVDKGWLKTLPPQIVYGVGMVTRVVLGFL